ncbi:MAG: FkbM family methyltransferase [Pseudomonadales bacterium]
MFKTPIIEGMQTFKKLWLDISGEQSITLADWIAEQEPERTGDFILQMDIEGAEYRNLIDAPAEVLDRFRIIVIEMHKLAVFDVHSRATAAGKLKLAIRKVLCKVWLPLRRLAERLPEGVFSHKLKRVLASNEPYLAAAVAEKLSKTHVCVHAHANNWAGDYLDPVTGMNVPGILELTFLRKDRFVGEATQFHAPQIPHPLDIVNVPEKPPLILNRQWVAGASARAP